MMIYNQTHTNPSIKVVLIGVLTAMAVLYSCNNSNLSEFANDSGYATVNGNKLFYHQYGKGTPLLVMHGGLGLDHNYLRALDELGEVAQIVYYDHLGNGRSQAPEDWNQVNFDRLTKDAKDLMRKLGYDKFVLYGHSYGSFIAQEYAVRYPETLMGLILSNAAPNIKDYQPKMPEWATPQAIAGFGQLFAGPMTGDEQWKNTWRIALPLYWKDMDVNLANAIHHKTQYRADAWNRGLQLLGNFEMKNRLKAIAVPTLVLGGRYDFITPMHALRDIAAELPDVQLMEFKSSAHYPMITEKSLYFHTIKVWLKRTL